MFVRKFALVLIFGSIAWIAQAQTQTRTTAFEYDPVTGLLSKEVIEPGDPNLCVATTYLYDNFGNRTDATTRNCSGVSNEAAAPAAGSPAVIATRTNNTSFAATAANPIAGQFATSIGNALGQQETRAYDARFGGMTSLIGPNNLPPTTWIYDTFGRKKQETRADTTTTTWTYTLCTAGACPANGVYYVTVTSTGAPISSTYYDKLNRELRSETQGFDDGSLLRKDTEYDARGRVARTSKPYIVGQTIYWTTFAYDDMNRVVTTTEPATDAGSMITTNDYNGLTTAVSVNSSPVQTKTTLKNGQGQVAKVTDAQGNAVTYTYDLFGNLVQTNAGGVVTTLGFDLRGRKTEMNDADLGRWTYRYDVLGELVWQCDPVSRSLQAIGGDCADVVATRIVYDKLGRMTSRTERDLVSTWTYDSCPRGIGKLCSAGASNTYSRTHTYDNLGRPTTLNATIDTTHLVTTTYVPSGPNVGKVDTVTYPTGFGVKNIYKTTGYLQQIQLAASDPAFPSNGALLWQAVSPQTPLLQTEMLGNLQQNRAFDALGRLKSVSTPIVSLTYSYDIVGNVKTRTDNVQTVTENFDYDILNRLKTAYGPNLTTRSFDYDPLGNMIYKSDVGTLNYPTAGSPQAHAVSSVSTGGPVSQGGTVTATYAYDANGNLYSGAGRTLAYTSFNMPATIGGPGATYTYTYSPEHERVRLVTVLPTGAQTTSVYLHPGGGALFYEKEIRPDATEHKHYVQAGASLIGVYVTKSAYAAGDGPGMRYYHRDNLGSVVAISNQAGARIETLAYEAFGKRRWPNGTADPGCGILGNTTDRGFTAHEHLDELCLIHMNGRVYDPSLGRFMTADPTIQVPGNLQSYNRYTYVWNNPLNSTDPSGFSRWTRFRDKAERVAVGVAALGLGGAATLAAGQAIVDHKDDIARFTSKTLGELGRVKYVGGLLSIVALTDPQFSIAYGWSTGDWKTVARAEATAAVIAATYWAGGLAFAEYAAAPSLLTGASYVAESAAMGYASTYSIARINGSSNDDARHAALLSAKRGALMAGARIGYNAVVKYDVTLEPGDKAVDKGPTGMPVKGAINIGTQDGPLNPNGWFNEGGIVSRAANQIPGVNAVSGLHDVFQITLDQYGQLARNVFNVPGMIPAALITYGALLGPIDASQINRLAHGD